jgi:hypothetical protein
LEKKYHYRNGKFIRLTYLHKIYIRTKEFVTTIVVVSLDIICKIKRVNTITPVEIDIKIIRKNFMMVEFTRGDG